MRWICLTLLSLCAALGAASAADLTPPAERSAVADFTLKDIKGNRVKLSDFKGKVIMEMLRPSLEEALSVTTQHVRLLAPPELRTAACS